MKYKDYKVGFTFEVPDYLSEVREASYEVFNVAENTLKYFIMLDDDGEIVRSFSFSKDEAPVKTDTAYKEVLEKNLQAMEDLGLTKLINTEFTTAKGIHVDRYVYVDLEMDEAIGLLLYFARIKDSLVVSSCYISNFDDFFETEMRNIYESIEVL